MTLGVPTIKNLDVDTWRRLCYVPFQPTFSPAGAGAALYTNFSYNNFGFDKDDDSVEEL